MSLDIVRLKSDVNLSNIQVFVFLQTGSIVPWMSRKTLIKRHLTVYLSGTMFTGRLTQIRRPRPSEYFHRELTVRVSAVMFLIMIMVLHDGQELDAQCFSFGGICWRLDEHDDSTLRSPTDTPRCASDTSVYVNEIPPNLLVGKHCLKESAMWTKSFASLSFPAGGMCTEILRGFFIDIPSAADKRLLSAS